MREKVDESVMTLKSSKQAELSDDKVGLDLTLIKTGLVD